jgi:hypothetical protein
VSSAQGVTERRVVGGPGFNQSEINPRGLAPAELALTERSLTKVEPHFEREVQSWASPGGAVRGLRIVHTGFGQLARQLGRRLRI